METDTSDPNIELSRVAFKAPPFWDNDPELWFLQVESQFVIANITADTTKFHSVVANLDAKLLAYVKDIIIKPPTENAYTSLKKRILAQFTQSETVRFKQLIQEIQLGDRRPSQLLVHMRNLAAGKVQNDLLKSLWLQRLPVNIQQILSTCKDELDDLATIADKIYEVSNSGNSVSSIAGNETAIDLLRSEIKTLTTEIKRLANVKYPSRSRSRYRKLSSSRRGNKRQADNLNLCWYHARFAAKAKKCIKPCEWSGNKEEHL